MRLTLRTMLAYLDDILEPDDMEDIGKKIEESEFATNLVHRTRDCMRRLRLGVAPLMDRGLASDPNSVAEYLDNTLSAERVPEFEKICLESDVHLAEVASCHQILTLVLGEPAEIGAESRQRMYRLAAHADAPPVQTDAMRASATPPVPPPHPPSRRPKPEVPDYLRETRSRWWPVAAMVAVAAMLTFAGLMVINPGQMRERVVALVQSSPEEPAAEAAADDAAATPDETAGAATSDSSGDAAGDAPDTAGETIGPANDTTDTAADAPGIAQPTPPGASGETGDDVDEPPAPQPGDTAVAAPDEVPPAGEEAPGEEMPADAAAADAAPDVARPEVADAADERPEGEGLGRYTSRRDVLLKFDPVTSDWKRLAAMAPLAKGDRLMSLPIFRPVITLSTSITIHAQGPSLVELIGWGDRNVPILGFEYGRFALATIGKAANSLQMKFDDRQLAVTFVDADSSLALEVRRVLPPGKDPESEAAPLAVDLYVTSGSVRVRDGEKTVDLQAPSHQTYSAFAGLQAGDEEFPKWVTNESPSEVERLATSTLEPLLQSDEPVALVLKEQTDPQRSVGRRREVRSLAIRSLGYLGDFEACVAMLNDPKERLNWQAYFDELRLAVARSPQTAAEVRTTFEKQRAGEAPGLYRMLWGYSGEDLKNGAAKDLVEALDNLNSLDYRVMGFLNLSSITGANYGYRPEDQAGKRRTPVKHWREQLRLGKIAPRTAASTKAKPPAKGT